MQTIGERLEEARKRKGISIREAAEATKIRGDYLQKFESNHFDLGLADLYVRGFLRSYSLFLKLPAEKLINDYNALTAGTPSSRRSPSREVYGRMDLSVASVDEAEAGTPPSSATPGESADAAGRRVPPSFTRGGGSISRGPAIDPNLIVKGALWTIGIVLVVLILWGLKSCIGTGTPRGSAATMQKAVVPAAPTFKIIAKGPLTVEVAIPKADDPDVAGEIIFRGELPTGAERTLARPGELLIRASAAENLDLEVAGKRIPFGPSLAPSGKGESTKRLPAP